jgi:hypothetical protein
MALGAADNVIKGMDDHAKDLEKRDTTRSEKYKVAAQCSGGDLTWGSLP